MRLLKALGANVLAVDDHVPPGHLAADATRIRLTDEAARSADAVVILTDHDDVDYDVVERAGRWILDCRNRLASPNVESL